MDFPLENVFAPCCERLTPIKTSNWHDPPKELTHFFSSMVMNPLKALNNRPESFSLLDTPYIIQITPVFREGRYGTGRRPTQYFIQVPENSEPEGSNQFVRFVSTGNMEGEDQWKHLNFWDHGYKKKDTFGWRCEDTGDHDWSYEVVLWKKWWFSRAWFETTLDNYFTRYCIWENSSMA